MKIENIAKAGDAIKTIISNRNRKNTNKQREKRPKFLPFATGPKSMQQIFFLSGPFLLCSGRVFSIVRFVLLFCYVVNDVV